VNQPARRPVTATYPVTEERVPEGYPDEPVPEHPDVPERPGVEGWPDPPERDVAVRPDVVGRSEPPDVPARPQAEDQQALLRRGRHAARGATPPVPGVRRPRLDYIPRHSADGSEPTASPTAPTERFEIPTRDSIHYPGADPDPTPEGATIWSRDQPPEPGDRLSSTGPQAIGAFAGPHHVPPHVTDPHAVPPHLTDPGPRTHIIDLTGAADLPPMVDDLVPAGADVLGGKPERDPKLDKFKGAGEETGEEPPPPSGKRVRVVLSKRRGSAPKVSRTADDVRELTQVGELLSASLIRSQLALALRVGGVAAITLGTWPALFVLFPVLGRVEFFGLRLPWLLLGLVAYPVMLALGYWHARQAEKLEQVFADHIQN
jgi:hypothetical protein